MIVTMAAPASLKMLKDIKLPGGTMLMALTGWMDGGLVSTGTLKGIMRGRKLVEVARIEADPFYIFNFPGSMELSAMFRPEVRYDEGIVKELDLPQNIFHYDEAEKLILFLGREPNLRWMEFSDCIFSFAKQAGISRIFFMGSFGGTVPHTRQPRMFAAVSHVGLKPLMKKHGFGFTDYHGPSSFATTLLSQCAEHDVEMMNLVCEIPGYLQGANPPSIEAVTRKLAHILNLQVDLDALRRASDEWEIQVTQVVEKDVELTETVRKLEEQYDNELIGKAEE